MEVMPDRTAHMQNHTIHKEDHTGALYIQTYTAYK